MQRQKSFRNFVVAVAVTGFLGCSDKPTDDELVRVVRLDLNTIAVELARYWKDNGTLPTQLDADVVSEQPVDWFSLNTPCNRYYAYMAIDGGRSFVVSSIGPDRAAATDDDVLVVGEPGGHGPSNCRVVSANHWPQMYRARAVFHRTIKAHRGNDLSCAQTDILDSYTLCIELRD